MMTHKMIHMMSHQIQEGWVGDSSHGDSHLGRPVDHQKHFLQYFRTFYEMLVLVLIPYP